MPRNWARAAWKWCRDAHVSIFRLPVDWLTGDSLEKSKGTDKLARQVLLIAGRDTIGGPTEMLQG